MDYLNKLHSINLSPSSINSFLWDKKQWFKSYILGEKQTSKEMTFGSEVDLRIQEDPLFLPNLPRYEKMQHKMNVMLGDIKLVGKPDGINLIKSKELFDYKTGKNPWTQKKAQDSIQLKFYLLLLYITEKINPEDFTCGIHWLPTKETGDFKIEFIKEGDIKTFKVKYTLADILKFATYIKQVFAEMEQFVANYKG